MDDNYIKGFITGMAMNPLFVTTETAPSEPIEGLLFLSDAYASSNPVYLFDLDIRNVEAKSDY